MNNNLASRDQLKNSYLEKVSQKESNDLGIELGAGAKHYRAFVGPPHLYDLIGSLQLTLLVDLGMREYNSVLEVGCGSLRLGRLLIPYLLSSRYYGIEPEEWLVNEGIKNHFGFDTIENAFFAHKKPRFSYNDQFDFSVTQGPVDFIIAQSIASHTGVKETKKLIGAIGDVMHDESVAIVTFIRDNNKDNENTEDGWFYPRCVTYTDQFMGDIAKNFGLKAAVSQWPMGNRRDFGLITSQAPLILSKGQWRPSIAQRFAGLSIESAIKRLSW
jgi:hypothetical protein